MSRYKVIIEDAINAYILDRSENTIVALCSTKRPDLGFKKLEKLVGQANKVESTHSDIQKGYIEIDKEFIIDSLENKEIPLDTISGVFIGKGEIVVTGIPNDEGHNCDAMGCNSINHVIYRKAI
ncbi:hypothetical protein NE686_18005 [Tissierella carlieri]|uniref:Uncharacterized protein n=1 Tax=Tissierella carlieri TaxID=689904 RepID=A0ABT1SEV8_9FIRM|nr:hypothetical protein [Tissierella carlieri]MCQ4925000.1 hypothetical protein [Tissierella carlieri]